MVNIRINILMKGAGKKNHKNKTDKQTNQTKTIQTNENPRTLQVQESWSNLKDTPAGIMEFNTASEEECKEKEMTSVILKFEG